MSRIHEALKRAEEERAASGTKSNGAGRDASPDLQSTLAMPGGIAGALMPSFSAQFSLDSLLARCPQRKWSPDVKTMLFFGEEPAPGTEQFRTLRSRLYQVREKQPLRKLLITSSLPKEGKSFVAANLAQAIVQQQGRRALLIDADLRNARLHLAFGTQASPGLTEYLQGEAEDFAVIQRGPMENLFFIPSGSAAPNPSELIANGRLKLLLSRVEALFDWIIIDSPPVVPVSDASVLARECDGVLVVVRSNSTPFDAARKARDEFGDKNLIGVVLNAVESSSQYSQYYYGDYGRSDAKAEVAS